MSYLKEIFPDNPHNFTDILQVYGDLTCCRPVVVYAEYYTKSVYK